jgi:hypothetical protein
MAASLKGKRTPITTPPYQVPSVDFTPDPPIFSLVTRVVDPDPDPYWIRIQLGLWIRIWIRIRNTDPDPDPGGQK